MKKRALAAVVMMLASALSAQSGKTTSGAPDVVPIDKEPSHHFVFENEYVRVFSVEVAPHSETKFHQHDRDYVWVSLGDSDVESVRVGAAAVALQPKDGDTQFTKGGFAHKAVNKSDKPFRNITVELKKGVGALKPAVLGNEVRCEGDASKDPARKCYEGARLGGIGSCSHCDCPKECYETKALLIGEGLEIDEAIVPARGKYWDAADSKNTRLLVAVSDAVVGVGKSAQRQDGTWSVVTWPSVNREEMKARSIRWIDNGEFEVYPGLGKRKTRIVVFNFFNNDETQGPSRQNPGARNDKAKDQGPMVGLSKD